MSRKYFDPQRVPKTPFVPHIPGAFDATDLPASSDFSSLVTIRDQGTKGSCTGFGLTGQYEVARAVAGYPHRGMLFSPEFMYDEESAKEGHPGQDTGAVPTDGLAIAQHIGFCPEEFDRYTDTEMERPTAKQIAAAKNYRIKSWSPVARIASSDPRTALTPALRLLAQKRPLAIAILVHQSFENATGGIIPIPTANDPLAGGHCMFLCGNQDDPSFAGGGYGLAANSWSEAWGAAAGGHKGGFAKIPYAYLYDGPLTLGMWSIELFPYPKPKAQGAFWQRLFGR